MIIIFLFLDGGICVSHTGSLHYVVFIYMIDSRQATYSCNTFQIKGDVVLHKMLGFSGKRKDKTSSNRKIG